MKTAFFRFYEELNDFLLQEKKKTKFPHTFIDRASVKDMIESMGVPHTEIDLILANGKSVDFTYIVEDGDEISVYPVFESLDISDVQRLRPEPLRNPKFILDVHLGTLARYLRLLGFDCLYENNYIDEQIVDLSIAERRTILTRDIGILKRKEVDRGYRVRNADPLMQMKEIVDRFDLKNLINEFTRCVKCNGELVKIVKSEILHRLPEKVKALQQDFYYCTSCDKIFWRGTHYIRMQKIVDYASGIAGLDKIRSL